MHALYQALLRLDAEVARQVALGARSDRLMGEMPQTEHVMRSAHQSFSMPVHTVHHAQVEVLLCLGPALPCTDEVLRVSVQSSRALKAPGAVKLKIPQLL
jgi:hypothetical protein